MNRDQRIRADLIRILHHATKRAQSNLRIYIPGNFRYPSAAPMVRNKSAGRSYFRVEDKTESESHSNHSHKRSPDTTEPGVSTQTDKKPPRTMHHTVPGPAAAFTPLRRPHHPLLCPQTWLRSQIVSPPVLRRRQPEFVCGRFASAADPLLESPGCE